MNFILGFGSTETEFENKEIKAFLDHVRSRYSELEPSFMSEKAFLDDIRGWLDKRADKYHAKAEEFRKAAEYPSRYSHFYPHITSSASAIVAIFKFSHINRRHAMSPDGWAMLQNERTAHLFTHDIN
tara:strand:- start:5042 stop:5422 length:381 start_codon:yes stop_codon:yes gene_type:complete